MRSICGQCEKPILNGKAVTEAAARNNIEDMCIVLFLSHHLTRHVQQHGSIQPSSSWLLAIVCRRRLWMLR